jgi:hypothetical protein
VAEVIRQTVEVETRITDAEDIRIVDPTPDVTCPIRIDCPESLLLNYSSETLNLNEFHSVFYGANGCIGRCTSTISQEDADLCAIRQAAECVLEPEEQCFGNDPQSCTTACPDGSSSYTFTVPANTFFYTTQAEADATALAYACEQAQQERFCLSFDDIPLACCLGTAIDEALTVSNDPGGLTYEITAGALPDGLSLDADSIVGTPTTAGNFAATIQVSDGLGNYSARELTISVITIADTSLPDYEVGVIYSHQMSVAGGTGPYTWELIGNALPDGMSMNSAGTISGTPTAAGDVLLTFQVTDTTKGVSCQKQLQLEGVVSGLEVLYYKLDATLGADPNNPTLIDSAGNADIQCSSNSFPTTAQIIPAQISNGLEIGGSGGLFASTALTPVLNMHNRSFTMRCWLKLDGLGVFGGSEFNLFYIRGGSGEIFRMTTTSQVIAVGPPVRRGSFFMAQAFTGTINVKSIANPYMWAETNDFDNTWIVDPNWHRIIVICDLTNLILSIRVDDGVPAQVALNPGSNFADSDHYLDFELTTGGGPGQGEKRFDEIGIWPGYVWTEADATYDWNGGAGRTYPDVPLPPY